MGSMRPRGRELQMRTRSRLFAVATLVAVAALAAACAPQAPGGGGIASKNWKFGGTQVTIDKSQDDIGTCWWPLEVTCQDEPYLLTVNFRVKIGQANSADTWVVNDRTNAPENTPVGATRYVDTHFPPAVGGEAVFGGVKALDVLDLTNPSNKLEVFGSYVWVAEEDQVGYGVAAGGVSSALKDALNGTLATADLSSLDASFILDLILGNIGNALGIVIQNIPLFGLGDDLLGGAMYIGIGAQGVLGGALDEAMGSTPFPAINIPVPVPPAIDTGGFYTLTGPKTFTHQFSGSGGKHTWVMKTGPA